MIVESFKKNIELIASRIPHKQQYLVSSIKISILIISNFMERAQHFSILLPTSIQIKYIRQRILRHGLVVVLAKVFNYLLSISYIKDSIEIVLFGITPAQSGRVQQNMCATIAVDNTLLKTSRKRQNH